MDQEAVVRALGDPAFYPHRPARVTPDLVRFGF